MAAPAIPQNVVAQQGNGQILITWNLISGITNYNVERSTDQVNWTNVASPTVPQYLDTSVTLGTTYYYRVSATQGVDTSGFSDITSETPTQPGQMTLGQLRELARQKADMVNSKFVTDKEFNTYINQSYFELYDLLVQKFGNEYFVAPPLVIPTNGTASLALPDGTLYSGARPFYKLLGVDLQLNAGSGTQSYITLHKYEFISRNRYVYPQLTTNLLAANAPRYRIVGNEIQFIPTPQSGQNLRLWYIPRMQTLLSDSDVADGVSGWTEYIAVDAAIKALQKEESDVSVLAAQKLMLEKRIEEAAENRDAGLPDTVSDVRRRWDVDLFGDGPFGGY